MDNYHGKDVVEQWWHHLFRVLLVFGFPLFVLVMSLVISLGNASYRTYSYSFENGYDKDTNGALNCSIYEYSKTINCGDLHHGDKFLSKYLARQDADIFDRVERQDIAEQQKNGYSPFQIAWRLIYEQKVTYRYHDQINYSKMALGLLIGGGVALFCSLLGWGFYKLVLYIVHGHTRLRKATV